MSTRPVQWLMLLTALCLLAIEVALLHGCSLSAPSPLVVVQVVSTPVHPPHPCCHYGEAAAIGAYCMWYAPIGYVCPTP